MYVLFGPIKGYGFISTNQYRPDKELWFSFDQSEEVMVLFRPVENHGKITRTYFESCAKMLVVCYCCDQVFTLFINTFYQSLPAVICFLLEAIWLILTIRPLGGTLLTNLQEGGLISSKIVCKISNSCFLKHSLK